MNHYNYPNWKLNFKTFSVFLLDVFQKEFGFAFVFLCQCVIFFVVEKNQSTTLQVSNILWQEFLKFKIVFHSILKQKDMFIYFKSKLQSSKKRRLCNIFYLIWWLGDSVCRSIASYICDVLTSNPTIDIKNAI